MNLSAPAVATVGADLYLDTMNNDGPRIFLVLGVLACVNIGFLIGHLL